jgi:hypothetical protein
MRIKQLLAALGMTVAIGSFSQRANAGEVYLGSSGQADGTGNISSLQVLRHDGYVDLSVNPQGCGAGSGIFMVPMSVPYSTSEQTVTGQVNVSYVGACTTPNDQYAQLVATRSDGTYIDWKSAKNSEASITIPSNGGLFAKIGVSCGCTTRVRTVYWR